METLGLYLLKEFFGSFDVFLLAFTRIIAFLIILPVFSGNNLNVMAKLGFAAAVAFMVTASGKISAASFDNNAAGFVLLLLQEFLTGFIAGFAIYMAFNLVFFTGQILDFQIGFSMVSVFDPVTQVQVPILGNLFFLTICALLIQSGGLHALLSAMFYSYDVMPIGGAHIFGNPRVINAIMGLMENFIVYAVQASMPVMGAILIIDVAMGLLVKAVPQMNVFVVGMPIKLLAGLMLVYMVVPILNNIYDIVFDMAYSSMSGLLKGMAWQ